MKYLKKMKTAAVTAAVILTSFAFLYFGTASFLDIGISDRLNQRGSVSTIKRWKNMALSTLGAERSRRNWCAC